MSVRDELIASLREMLRAHSLPLLQHESTTKLLLERAVTKKKRQEMLALFFRSVFAEVLPSSLLATSPVERCPTDDLITSLSLAFFQAMARVDPKIQGLRIINHWLS